MAKQKQQYIGTHKVNILRSGSFNVKIKQKNGTQVSITAPTIRELRYKVQEYESTGHAIQTQTFVEAVEDYIDTCELAGHSPATIMAYRSIAKNCFSDLGAMKIDRITGVDVQRAINAYARNHTPKSVRNVFGLIHKVLSIVRPNLDLRQIILPKQKKAANEDAGIVIPDDDMIAQLLDYTEAKDPELYKAILLAATTGLRRSELCALRWQDINFDFGYITVDKAVVMGVDMAYHEKEPKSSAGTRTNPISRDVLDILRQFHGAPDDPVVNLTPNVITYRYCRLRDKLKIPGRFHDLRHYHASVMVALGIPETYAMRDMGHSTPGLYKKVYAHMIPQARNEMYAALATQTSNMLKKRVEQKVEQSAETR